MRVRLFCQDDGSLLPWFTSFFFFSQAKLKIATLGLELLQRTLLLEMSPSLALFHSALQLGVLGLVTPAGPLDDVVGIP